MDPLGAQHRRTLFAAPEMTQTYTHKKFATFATTTHLSMQSVAYDAIAHAHVPPRALAGLQDPYVIPAPGCQGAPGHPHKRHKHRDGAWGTITAKSVKMPECCRGTRVRARADAIRSISNDQTPAKPQCAPSELERSASRRTVPLLPRGVPNGRGPQTMEESDSEIDGQAFVRLMWLA